MNDLKRLTRKIRTDILTISNSARIGHVGSALSIVEILTLLYFEVLKVTPKNPNNLNRDRFILSNGHTAAALYSILFRKGYFDRDTLDSFCHDGTKLMVHPEFNSLPGVDWGSGSLGHGLSAAVGMAYGAKTRGYKFGVFCMISDGESQEGSIWEAALLAGNFSLDNLVVILNYNGTQGLGNTKEVMDLEPLEKKWQSFKFATVSVDGHNLVELKRAFKTKHVGKPLIIISKTTLGKGVSFMEKDFRWHYFDPKSEHLKLALEEINR